MTTVWLTSHGRRTRALRLPLAWSAFTFDGRRWRILARRGPRTAVPQ